MKVSSTAKPAVDEYVDYVKRNTPIGSVHQLEEFNKKLNDVRIKKAAVAVFTQICGANEKKS